MKVVQLQKAQAEANQSCNEEVAGLKRNLQAVTAAAQSGSQEAANLKGVVHARDQTLAEKDAIITSLQSQVQEGRHELKKQADQLTAEKSHSKDACSPYIHQLDEKEATIERLTAQVHQGCAVEHKQASSCHHELHEASLQLNQIKT